MDPSPIEEPAFIGEARVFMKTIIINAEVLSLLYGLAAQQSHQPC
jgi:hypothetical protein